MGEGLRLIDLFDNRDAKQDEARWIPPGPECESPACHEHSPPATTTNAMERAMSDVKIAIEVGFALWMLGVAMAANAARVGTDYLVCKVTGREFL